MVSNYDLKKAARVALKDSWQTTLMVALIASLPSLISQVISIRTNASTNQLLSDLVNNLQQDATIGELQQLLETSGLSLNAYVPTMAVALLSFLVSPFLNLGLLHYFFLLLRGEKEVGIGTVFSRRHCFLKAIGLNLLTSLRTMAWMLPGAALMVLAIVVGLLVDSDALFLVLLYAGFIAMLVLGIRAALRYAMSSRVLAERPEKGIRQCIRESIRMMDRRKMLLVSLEVSFLLLSIGVSIAEYLLAAMLGSVLGSTLSMALSFAVNIYMQMAISAFYVVYRAQTEF